MALIGIGCAPFYMGALYMFGRAFAPVRFAVLSSTLLAIGSVGNLIGATPLAYAAETLGWRTTFVAIAVITALAALVIAVFLRDPERLGSTARDNAFFAGLREILSIRGLWPILPMVLVSYAVLIAEHSLWVGPYFTDVHALGPIDPGNAVLAMSIGALAIGPLDQIFATRKRIVAFSGSMIAASFVMPAYGRSPA